MINNYLKAVSRDVPGKIKNQYIYPFDDGDNADTARAISLVQQGGMVSVFRPIPGMRSAFPVIGQGGGFS